MRLASGRSSGRPNPPASSAAVNPRGNSTNASGLPRVSATIRSRTRSSSRPGTTESSRARASSSLRPDDHKLRKPRQLLVLAGLTHREHDGDRFRQEAARDERKRLRRGPVEPLCIIDQADERPLLSRLGQQSERRQTDQEAIRRLPGDSGRMPCSAPRAAGPAGAPGCPASARRADAGRRTRSPSRTQRPPRAQRDTQTPAPAGSPTDAVLPTPASPRRTSTWLWPASAAVQQPVQRLALLAPTTKSRPRVTIRHAHHPPRRDRPTTLQGQLAQPTDRPARADWGLRRSGVPPVFGDLDVPVSPTVCG